jgi:hypothetical protein
MNPLVLLLLLSSTMLAGCDALIGIFEAGAWFGIVLAIIVIGIVALLFSVFRRK